MLDDTDTFEWLLSACDSLSQARVPSEIAKALMGARMTALTKPNGGVRGIATRGSLRRLVARTFAKQFSKVFETECAPFQYALSTRAGTDCVGHMLRAATDAKPTDHLERGWDWSLRSCPQICDVGSTLAPGHSSRS